MRMNSALAATTLTLMMTTACGPQPSRGPSTAEPKSPAAPPTFEAKRGEPGIVTPTSEIVTVRTGQTPDLGNGPLFSSAGAFSTSGPVNPGTASYAAAPVIDWQSNTGPSSVGTGTWTSIQVGGSTYNSSNADAVAAIFPDGSGVDYLVLSAFTEELDPTTGVTIGTVMHVMVPASDFSIGGSVNLDGVDRLAIFARGDISLPEPQISAAAVTGTVTFSAGGLALGDLITADLAGDFAEFTWPSQPQQPPPAQNNLTPGSYTLTYDPTPNVYCDGTLAGQEPAFAAVTLASIGFTNGPVTLTAGSVAGTFEISGSPITSGYGVASLTLEGFPDAPAVVGGFVNGSGGGPNGTTFAGTYLAFDGASATPTAAGGWAGAGYMTPAQDGFCQVDFLVDLGP